MLITDAKMFRPQILTSILRANETIAEHEEVAKLAKLQVEENETSKIYYFAVQYKDFRTQRHAPDHVILKLNKQSTATSKREFDFYQRIVSMMKRRVEPELLRFPTCFDAYYDEENNQSHIILDNITNEFKSSGENAPPTARHREQVIDTLAHLHGYWWEHPILEELLPLPSEENIAETLSTYQSRLEELKQSVGQYLEKKHIDVLERIAIAIPDKRKADLLSGKSLTIIHSKLTPENLLYSPLESRITHWQEWTIGKASDDLAYMILCFWSEHLRKFQEKPLLKRYYNILLHHKVENYSWDDLLFDYKASLGHIIGTMLARWTRRNHASGAWREIENAIDVFIEVDALSAYD